MAETVLPFLIHHILLQGSSQYNILSRQARRFFAHCSYSFASPASSSANSATQSDGNSTSFAIRSTHGVNAPGSRSSENSFSLPPMQSMKTMLDILAFLRGQARQVRVRYVIPLSWVNVCSLMLVQTHSSRVSACRNIWKTFNACEANKTSLKFWFVFWLLALWQSSSPGTRCPSMVIILTEEICSVVLVSVGICTTSTSLSLSLCRFLLEQLSPCSADPLGQLLLARAGLLRCCSHCTSLPGTIYSSAVYSNWMWWQKVRNLTSILCRWK